VAIILCTSAFQVAPGSGGCIVMYVDPHSQDDLYALAADTSYNVLTVGPGASLRHLR